MSGQRQIQLPYSHGARGIPAWRGFKLSEPWEDGDVLKFTVDMNENKIVFQRADKPKKKLQNVLHFTNQNSPESVHVRAFVGSVRKTGVGTAEFVRLTIV